MLKPEQVPDTCEWHAIVTSCVEGATWKDIIAAAINAWPGLWMHPYTKNLTLPMPQEDTNAEG